MKTLLCLALAVLTSSCAAAEISTAPLAVRSDVIANGLRDAAFNLRSAAELGILKPDDAALACVNDVVKDAGLEGEAPKSFSPHVSDLISAASVAYIEAKRIQALRGTTLPQGCEAVIGRLVIDGAKAGVKLAPGTGLLR
jgi:hypothetical protein